MRTQEPHQKAHSSSRDLQEFSVSLQCRCIRVQTEENLPGRWLHLQERHLFAASYPLDFSRKETKRMDFYALAESCQLPRALLALILRGFVTVGCVAL